MKHLLYTVLLLFSVTSAFGQTKKPTIMLLPSDNWCSQRYYITSYDDQGTKISVPDYKLAFQEDLELGPVISKIGGLLTSLGYSLKDAEQETKSLSIRQAEDNVTTSGTSGVSLSESPLDIIKRRIKSDIVIQIWWNINKDRNGKSVTYVIEAFDAYTNKRIATSSETTKATNDIVPILLEKAFSNKIHDFDKQLSLWFENQQIYGREVSLQIRCWNNWGNNLETEYNGEELIDCIQDWLTKNCVNGAFNLSDGTENFAQFEQVHIPIHDGNGRAIDARAFGNSLRKYLQQSPFNITSKIIIRGLGEALIVLGEK